MASLNDPLHVEKTLAGDELTGNLVGRVSSKDRPVYSGFYAITHVIDETYRLINDVDSYFSRNVPKSAFAYYAAVLAYARMIKILKTSKGLRVNPDEDSFMDLVYRREFKPPKSLSYYLKGFGNATLPDQQELRFRAKCRNHVKSTNDDSIGWFGRVDSNTHYLYASYPCLAVYLKRIQADYKYSMDGYEGMWNLPNDIAPEDEQAGKPTTNLLGWAPATELSEFQLKWLRSTGFDPDFEFDSLHESIPFVSKMMEAVQQKLNYSQLKTGELASTNQGSLAQTIVTTLEKAPELPRPEGCWNTIAKHYFHINDESIIVAAKSLRYLQQHQIASGEKELNTWSIYSWNAFKNVPNTWVQTANSLYDASDWMFKNCRYSTTGRNPALETAGLVHDLMAYWYK